MKINTGLINGIQNINVTYDFTNKIKDRNDILAISPCQINGKLEFIDLENLACDLHIKCELTLSSSRSLEPVNYDLDFYINLLFGSSKDADFVLDKELPLSDIIFGHILVEKPVSIYLDEETEVIVEDKKKVNPAFKGLADWHK